MTRRRYLSAIDQAVWRGESWGGERDCMNYMMGFGDGGKRYGVIVYSAGYHMSGAFSAKESYRADLDLSFGCFERRVSGMEKN